jgi:hypothetical protein
MQKYIKRLAEAKLREARIEAFRQAMSIVLDKFFEFSIFV